MVRIAAVAALLGAGVLTPAAADRDQVSGWLIEGRPKLVEITERVKLAMLCQRLPIRMDRATFETIMTSSLARLRRGTVTSRQRRLRRARPGR